MLSCSIWFSAPSFWMGGGFESRCVVRVYGADGAVFSKSWAFHFHSTKFSERYIPKDYVRWCYMDTIVFKTAEPNPYKTKVYYQVSIFYWGFHHLLYDCKWWAGLGCLFHNKVQGHQFFDKEEKISHPRLTLESHPEPKCMQCWRKCAHS